MNPKRGPDGAQEVTPDIEVLLALAGLDATASLAIAHRTRRAIRDRSRGLLEAAARRRRNAGFALLGFLAFLTLITPALWSGVDEFMAGEHLSDLPTMITLLALTVFCAVVAALMASWKSHQRLR